MTPHTSRRTIAVLFMALFLLMERMDFGLRNPLPRRGFSRFFHLLPLTEALVKPPFIYA
jgi:hypothetical protein